MVWRVRVIFFKNFRRLRRQGHPQQQAGCRTHAILGQSEDRGVVLFGGGEGKRSFFRSWKLSRGRAKIHSTLEAKKDDKG